MRKTDHIPSKICSREELKQWAAQIRAYGRTIGFTNGIFDILHRGHIASLSQAAANTDYLVVGINSDASTKRLKGESRPVNDEQSRALLMASLLMVDKVVIFEEDTPLELITSFMPDVLTKGGDYTVEQVAGAKEVIANGGKVVINPIVTGFSTTSTIEKLGL